MARQTPRKLPDNLAAKPRGEFVRLRPHQEYVDVESNITIRRVRVQEIDEALALFLGDSNTGGSRLSERVEVFRKLAQQEQYDLTRQIVAVVDGKLCHACIFVPHAGRTAFVFTSCPQTADKSTKPNHQQAVALKTLPMPPVPTDSVRWYPPTWRSTPPRSGPPWPPKSLMGCP